MTRPKHSRFYEEGISVIGLSYEARNSWSRLLDAQKFRTPRDISQLKSSVEQVWNRVSPPLREGYAARRSPKELATPEEFWAQLNPAYADELALSVARTLMVHEGICHLLSQMRWCVLDVPEGCDSLLTSDNPVWMTATLVGANDFVLVAIGPRRLFVAAVEPDTLVRTTGWMWRLRQRPGRQCEAGARFGCCGEPVGRMMRAMPWKTRLGRKRRRPES